MDERVSIIEKVDHSERVVICRRLDGSFTYKRHWADPSVLPGPDYGWGTASATAESEAMQRVAWLKANFH